MGKLTEFLWPLSIVSFSVPSPILFGSQFPIPDWCSEVDHAQCQARLLINWVLAPPFKQDARGDMCYPYPTGTPKGIQCNLIKMMPWKNNSMPNIISQNNLYFEKIKDNVHVEMCACKYYIYIDAFIECENMRVSIYIWGFIIAEGFLLSARPLELFNLRQPGSIR